MPGPRRVGYQSREGIIVSHSLKTASIKADLIRSLSQYVLFARLAFFFFLRTEMHFLLPLPISLFVHTEGTDWKSEVTRQ